MAVLIVNVRALPIEMPHHHRALATVPRGFAVSILNTTLFIGAFLVAARVFPIVSALFPRPVRWEDLREFWAFVVCVYIPVGALTRIWTPRVWNAAIPATVAFGIVSAILKWTIHATDVGAVSTGYSLADYITWTTSLEIGATGAAALSAAGGWLIAGRVGIPYRVEPNR